MSDNFLVSKVNPQGLIQERILQIDYEAKQLKNLKKGKVQKVFAFSDIVDVQKKDKTTGLVLSFKNSREYQIFLPSEKERTKIYEKLTDILNFSGSEGLKAQVVKSGFCEKKGKLTWSARRIILLEIGEIHCFRLTDKDQDAGQDKYPLTVIRIQDTAIRKTDKNIITLITSRRKYEFKYGTEGEREDWFVAIKNVKQSIVSVPTSSATFNGSSSSRSQSLAKDTDPETDDDEGGEIQIFVYDEGNLPIKPRSNTSDFAPRKKDNGSKQLNPIKIDSRPYSQSLQNSTRHDNNESTGFGISSRGSLSPEPNSNTKKSISESFLSSPPPPTPENSKSPDPFRATKFLDLHMMMKPNIETISQNGRESKEINGVNANNHNNNRDRISSNSGNVNGKSNHDSANLSNKTLSNGDLIQMTDPIRAITPIDEISD